MTKIAQLYNLYANHPRATSAEAAEITGIDVGNISLYRKRLADRGLIAIDEDKVVSILKPYREGSEGGSYKATIYQEMVDAYMDDFRE